MVEDIFRNPTEEEKKDFLQLGVKNEDQIFKSIVEPIAHDFMHKKRTPFCYACAKIEFKRIS